MNIILPVHKKWCDKILSGEKPFDFRTKIPKELNIGDKIYLNKKKKNGGSGKIVGNCKVEEFIRLTDKNGKYPCFGAYFFIDYYFEKIVKDKNIAEKFKSVKKEFDGKFEQYKFGFIINYALCDKELEHIRKTGRPIDTFRQFPFANDKTLQQILEENEKTNKCIVACDEWLSKIGFYDEYDESKWNYAIKICDVEKYDEPYKITELTDKNHYYFKKAPQSFAYTTM